MQFQPLQMNCQYFQPSLLGTDIFVVKLQIETPTLSALRDKDWIILEEFCDAGNRKWQGRASGSVCKAWERAARVLQPGRGGCIPPNMPGTVHLLFKAPVLCDHRNSKSIQAQKFLIVFLGKACLKLLANVICTTEMTPPTCSCR